MTGGGWEAAARWLHDHRLGIGDVARTTAAACTRQTKTSGACRWHAQDWPPGTGLPDPQSCRTHLTRDEIHAWLPAAVARYQAELEVREQATPAWPACWSWPVTADIRHRIAEADADDGDRRAEALNDILTRWQAGRCAICGRLREALQHDHDHYTGWERGLLCQTCNADEGRSDLPVFVRYRARNPASMLGVALWYGDPDRIPDELMPTEDELIRHQAESDPGRPREAKLRFSWYIRRLGPGAGAKEIAMGERP